MKETIAKLKEVMLTLRTEPESKTLINEEELLDRLTNHFYKRGNKLFSHEDYDVQQSAHWEVVLAFKVLQQIEIIETLQVEISLLENELRLYKRS